MPETLVVPLFVLLMTLALGTGFYFLYQGFQRSWNARTEEFRDQKAPTVALMMQLAKEHDRAAQVIDQLEEQHDRLQYRLEVFRDLSEVIANFADGKRMDEDEFKSFLINVILAATQVLLPTQVNTRARFLVFNGSELTPYASYVPETAAAFIGRSFTPGEGAVGSAFESRRAVIVTNAQIDKLFQAQPDLPYRSVLCVPVPANGREPIGVLNVDSPEVSYFTEEDAKTLAHVANLVHVLWFLQFPLVRQGAGDVVS